MPASNGFERAERELVESWPVRLFGAAADAMVRAGGHSAAFARVREAAFGFRTLPPGARLGLVTLAIAVAVVVHVLLAAFVPPRVAPTIPRAAWIAVGIVSAAVAIAASRSR